MKRNKFFNDYFLYMLCDCRFDLDELDQLRDAGPLVLVANHPSLLDAVLVLARVPDTVCVMKADLMDNLPFGAAARLARFIRNDAPLRMISRRRRGTRPRCPPADLSGGHPDYRLSG